MIPHHGRYARSQRPKAEPVSLSFRETNADSRARLCVRAERIAKKLELIAGDSATCGESAFENVNEMQDKRFRRFGAERSVHLWGNPGTGTGREALLSLLQHETTHSDAVTPRARGGDSDLTERGAARERRFPSLHVAPVPAALSHRAGCSTGAEPTKCMYSGTASQRARSRRSYKPNRAVSATCKSWLRHDDRRHIKGDPYVGRFDIRRMLCTTEPRGRVILLAAPAAQRSILYGAMRARAMLTKGIAVVLIKGRSRMG